jgi:hypothetical protein
VVAPAAETVGHHPAPAPPPPHPPAASDNPHRYGRALLSGPFYATDARWGFFDTPGTIEVILAGTDPANQIGHRLLVADAEDPLAVGIRSADRASCTRLAAVYFNVPGFWLDADMDELAIARAIADRCDKPVLVYYDRPNSLDPAVQDFLRPGDILGINAYPDTVPAPPDTARDMTDLREAVALGVSWGYPIAIIRPFYTRTGEWPIDYIVSFQVPITDLIRETPQVVMDLWFSWGRPSGAVDFPVLQQHAAWLDEAARTGR